MHKNEDLFFSDTLNLWHFQTAKTIQIRLFLISENDLLPALIPLHTLPEISLVRHNS
jgi:hypothetical protein